ncbi:6,7-dimethyl-8-ribityllumazine synthase [bacterium]|nr:MAG: 6,7-dimethyl-8-ribityllumazine synthase [Candidatus Hinthialibacteria bacterium OLB16]MBK7495653.1 6,7-dimethyl-8-ribityllumazine synthase [Candidatus Omnitrophota bacterium]MCK6497588.1 6,7-dimethyl-8-ribityllumazine synthase [bacterium]
MKTIEGQLTPVQDAEYVIIASRFNHFITDRLLSGALDGFSRHGVPEKCLTLVWVPGAWEIPVAARRLAESKRYSAIVCLGCVIRGSTDHYEHVSSEAAKGMAQVALSSGIPVINAVLATHNLEQAIERAGSKQGNKGFEAACTAIEMTGLLSAIGKAKP